MKRILVTTSIPYVNAPPHLGFALELVLADAIARHERSHGHAVRLQSGTDDNSLKNALAAEAAGVTVRELVDRHAQRFAALNPLLGIDCDDFLRTGSDPRHAPAVARLWRACEASGDIYVGEYRGLYCVGCEQYYTEAELVDGRCPEHGVAPEAIAERNHFFRLSRYQDALRRLIESDELSIRPAHRRNEVLAFLRRPLADISISRSIERSRGWGIPVPGDAQQTVYVWFDALANYISAAGYASDERLFRRNWSDADSIRHVIGKGVTRFHAVYWPAILLSAGLRLPTEILVHGYVTVDGRKLGKSLGNAIAPDEACAAHGADALRYFLLRHVGSHHDGDFSRARLAEVHDHELANDLGNLVSRVTALQRRHGAATPRISSLAAGLLREVGTRIDAFAPHRALEAVFRVVSAGNAHLNRTEPWQLAKAGRSDEVQAVLGELCATLREVARALEPLLPDTAARVHAALDGSPAGPLFPRAGSRSPSEAPPAAS